MSECLSEEILQSFLDAELSRESEESVTAHLALCLSCADVAQKMDRENSLVSAALTPEFEASVPSERLRQRLDAAVAGTGAVNPGALDVAAQSKFGRWLQAVADSFTLNPQRAFGYAGLMAVLIFALIFAVVQRRNLQSTPDSQSVATVQRGTDGATNVVALPPASLGPDRDTRVLTGASANAGPRRPRNTSARVAQPRSTATVAHHVKLLPGERSYLQTIAELDSTIKLDRGGMKPALQAEYERNLAFVDRALAAARTAAKSNPNDPDAAEFMFSAYQSKVDLLNTVADARVYDKQH